MHLKVLVLLVTISRIFATLQLCEKDNSVDITKGTHLSNGDVFLDGIKYDKSEYYIDTETGTEKGCICTKQTCVRKCCPVGTGYDPKQKICVNVMDVFDPPVWDEYRLMKNVNSSEMFRFVFGKVNCTHPEYRIRIGQATKHFHLRMNGDLYIEVPQNIPPWITVGPDKYCIDTFMYAEETGIRTHLDALVCFRDTQDDHNTYPISSACMLISCVFILATVAVYAWLPELRNLHGRVLMAYLLCLFVGFVFMSTMQILLLINNIAIESCVWMTFVIYFFLLSAFFWLNVMCFDIWWTFSGKRGLAEKLSIRARFCAYAMYAFGVPSALTVMVAGLEFSGLPAHPLLPNIKHQGCFLSGISRLIYFYGPIVVLCVANVLFFILTAVKITQIKRQTSVLKSKESAMHDQHRNENDKQRLLLYVKLFVVMGINWLLEVISAIYPNAASFWRYTDAYNVLIGLIIFIIFVCKRKILRLMKKRYRQLRGDPMSRTQTLSSRTASSRDDIRMSSVKTSTS